MREFCLGAAHDLLLKTMAEAAITNVPCYILCQQGMNVGTLFQMGYDVKAPADVDVT